MLMMRAFLGTGDRRRHVLIAATAGALLVAFMALDALNAQPARTPAVAAANSVATTEMVGVADGNVVAFGRQRTRSGR
jgi:hypothetical protein